MGNEFAHSGDVSLAPTHIDHCRSVHSIRPCGCERCVYEAKGRCLELLEEELRQLLVFSRCPGRLCDEQDCGVERRVEGVVDVGDEREETRPVRDLAVLNGPYRSFFRDAIFFPYNLVVAVGGWLGFTLRFSLRFSFLSSWLLNWLLDWLVLPPPDLVRLELALLFGREHARPYAHARRSERLWQTKLRQSSFRTRRNNL